jgi:hypothetical protein
MVVAGRDVRDERAEDVEQHSLQTSIWRSTFVLI